MYRQTGSWPETGLEEIKCDLLQADFGTTSHYVRASSAYYARHLVITGG